MPLKDAYLANPRQFLWDWVVRMPGGANDGGGTPARAGDYMRTMVMVDPDQDLRAPRNLGYQIAAATVNVAWHEVARGELKLIVQGSTNAATLNIPPTEWFPAYVLPWNQGCSARMQLPAAAANARAFFTAEMNGCCFLVGGQPNNPVVCHLNVGDFADPGARELAWQKMVTRSAKGQPMGNMSALRKWDVAPTATQAKGFDQLGFRHSQYQASGQEQATAVASFNQELAASNRKGVGGAPILDLKVSTMGIGDPATGTWEFFYQRNLYALSPQVVTKLGTFGGLQKKLFGDNRRRDKVEKYIRMGGSEYIVLWPRGAGRLVVPPAPDDVDIGNIFD